MCDRTDVALIACGWPVVCACPLVIDGRGIAELGSGILGSKAGIDPLLLVLPLPFFLPLPLVWLDASPRPPVAPPVAAPALSSGAAVVTLLSTPGESAAAAAVAAVAVSAPPAVSLGLVPTLGAAALYPACYIRRSSTPPGVYTCLGSDGFRCSVPDGSEAVMPGVGGSNR